MPERVPVKGKCMHPSTFRRVAGGVSAALLIGATFLSTAGLTSAAVPTATATSEAIPASYSPGHLAGFRGVLDYGDGSTLSKLYLSVTSNGASGSPYASATRNGAVVANACTFGDTVTIVTCTLKQIRFNDRVVVVVAFTPLTTASAVTATYRWGSTGFPTTDGGNSHGDTWPNPVVTQTSSLLDNANYGGGFNIDANGTIDNGLTVTATNRQVTKLAKLPAGVPATVQDGANNAPEIDCDPNNPNTPQITCSGYVGEWSNVDVGDGQTFDSVFTVSIVFYSGTPKSFVHTFATAPYQEVIGPCAKKSPTYPCFTWSASTNTATIFTYHNGSYRGQ
jgi:hypothetical protein